jgi:hypothetical protein
MRDEHASTRGIPDIRFINQDVPVAEVAAALDLRFDGRRKIHCWHPDRHKNGDRTASVGIRSTNNTVKCFGCDSKPMGPIDMVMDVLSLSTADAALWVAARFDVPTIPARKHLTDSARRRDRVGLARGLGLLIRSGLWATLSEAAQAIAPVLLELSEKQQPSDDKSTVKISYLGMARYSGVRSPNSIRKALVALSEVSFLELPESAARRSPDRQTATYSMTPDSDQLWELAQAFAKQTQMEIAAEKELRARLRKEKIRSFKGEKQGPGGAACTKYKSLYSTNSVNKKNATPRIASSEIGTREDLLNINDRLSINHSSRR